MQDLNLGAECVFIARSCRVHRVSSATGKALDDDGRKCTECLTRMGTSWDSGTSFEKQEPTADFFTRARNGQGCKAER